VCTKNPFYVLSAGLFLAGLWLSFGAQQSEADTWALMSGLAGYTLLLAATACLLVRFGNVWDDVRTVLLLVVLMFLATSVTFDDILVFSPARGLVCYLGGLAFAVAVSEGLLRGIRLRLPALFRGPYYLILALFFLYPLALRPLVGDPHGEALQWGLFAFPAVAGLAFLTLLPAVWRGPAYVRDNGSPWPWPLYPWVLFGVFAFAVPGRAYLLCRSLHLVESGGLNQLIFGPYFLVSFGLALAVLLMEMGLASKRPGAVAVALAAPVGLVALTLVGHRDDRLYRGFLGLFADRLGGDPLALTLTAAAAFYGYAAVRRVPLALDALAATLAAVAFVGPQTMLRPHALQFEPPPLLAAAGLEIALAAWRRDSIRALVGAAGLVAVAVLSLPLAAMPLRGAVAFHMALLAVWVVGAALDDPFARWLRGFGCFLAVLACLAFVSGDPIPPAAVPPWLPAAYVPAMVLLLAGYGRLVRHTPSLVAAGVALAAWLVAFGWQSYLLLREHLAGLDHIAVSLALFAVAVLVSLGKSGQLSRWLRERLGPGLVPAGPSPPDRPGLAQGSVPQTRTED
jgi:hypothetical protein